MPLSDEELEAIFHPPKKEVVEDVTMGDDHRGLGLPGEVFDLLCPECPMGKMQLRKSKYGFFYGCSTYPLCHSSHGARPDGRPLGIPGDKATKKARIFAHCVFDRLWKEEDGHKPAFTRVEAYAWLRETLSLSAANAHIGRFTVDQCNTLITAVKKECPFVLNAWDRITLDEEPF